MSETLWISDEEEKEKDRFARSQRGYQRAVVWLCKRFPSAIGDYTRLVIYFWKYISHATVTCQHCGKQTQIWMDSGLFDKIGRPESIDRAYRKAVEQFEIIEPLEVQEAKRHKQMLFHGYFGNGDAE